MLFCTNSGFSQTVFEDWVQPRGSQSYFLKSIVKTDSYRNVYQAGATLSSNGDYDVIITKFNPQGQELWNKTYDVAGYDDAAIDIYIDNNQNVYLVGTTFNPANNGYRTLTLKYKSNGDFGWADIYSHPGSLYNVATSITGYGNNIFVGGATYNLANQSDFLAISYSSTGNLEWTNTWNNMGLSDVVTKIYYLGGRISLGGGTQISPNSWRYAVVNLNAGNGGFENQRITGGSGVGIDRVTDLTRDNAGNIYVTGGAVNSGTGYDFKTLKLDSNLNVTWTASYNSAGTNNDIANALAVDPYGNVYVTGYSETDGGFTKYTTLKYNAGGSQQWLTHYNGNANGADTAKAIVLDANNQPIITGVSENTSNQDFHTIKYSTNGEELWNITYNGVLNGNDNPFDIAIDNAGDIIVAGQTEVGGMLHYTSVKYIERDIVNPPDDEIIPSSGYFTKNAGQLVKTNEQFASEVKFIAGADYPKVYVHDDKLSYVFHKSDSLADDTIHRIDMVFNKRTKTPRMRALDKMDFYQNFYLPTVADGKRERVESFKKLISLDVWNNIDLMLSHNNMGLKYYLICKPGFNPADLGWGYEGATSVSVNGLGELVLTSSIGEVVMPKGAAYEVTSSGSRIDKSWQPIFNATGSEVSLSIGAFNTNNTLVIEIDKGVVQGTSGTTSIDNLMWSTYYGGEGVTTFHDMATDVKNNAYVTGRIDQGNFPLSPGLIEINGYSGNIDAITFKLNSDLVPIWATYFGGTSNDNSRTISVSDEKVYIAGFTTSFDLIIEDNNGVYFSDDTNENCSSEPCQDAFIAQFQNDGSLNWSTYYGESGEDFGAYKESINDIAVDDLGNLYCVGTRNTSTLSHHRPGAFNSDSGPAMVLMFDSDNQLKWATAYNATEFNSVKTDNNNRVYISGATLINSSPVLNHDSDLSYTASLQNAADGYVLSFDETGQPMYSFFYGGQCNDYCSAIDVDDNNNVYVIGSTYASSSCNMSNSLAVIDGYSYSSNTPELFAFKIDNYISGEANISKATYFGGGGADGLGANQAPSTVSLSVASNGSFVITASTTSHSITHPPAIQTPSNQPDGYYVQDFAYQGSGLPQEDVLIAYFNTNFDLIWSTYFGGSKQDVCAEVVITEDNTRMYLAGAIATNNFPSNNVTVAFPIIEYDVSSQLDYIQDIPPSLSGYYPFMAMFDISGIPVSVNSLENEDNIVNVYPNPTDRAVIVEPKINTKYRIEVYDVFGKKLYSGDNNHGPTRIDLISYSSGIYLVNIVSDNQSYTVKLIKQ